jgi:hypothetical protein
MQTATINKGLTQPGDHIIIAIKEELQDMVSVYTEYCKNNPRKKKVKKVLQQFEDELQIY